MYKTNKDVLETDFANLLVTNDSFALASPVGFETNSNIFSPDFANTVSRFYDPNNRFIAENGTDDFAGDITTTGVVVLDGASVSGELEMAGDDDWFALEVITPGTVSISALSSSPSLERKLGISLYNSTGIYIDGTPSSFNGFNNFTIDLPFAGTYFVGIDSTHYSGGGAGTYSLNAFIPEEDDYANNATTTGGVTLGGSVTATSEIAGDTDWFAINIAQDNTQMGIDFSLASTIGGGINAVIFDSSSNVLSFVSSNYVFQTAGDYFIAVKSGKYIGDYTLTTEFQGIETPGDTSTTETLLVDAPFLESQIDFSGDMDWYQIDLVEGQFLNFSIAPESSARFSIALHDQSENILASRSGDGGGEFQYLVTQTGSYYFSLGGGRTGDIYRIEAKLLNTYNVIYGTSNEYEEIDGTANDDLIYGLGGLDKINGFAGDDIINGGNGLDIIDGGAGDDTMDGGGGSNIYKFRAGEGADYIDRLDIPNDLIILYDVTSFSYYRPTRTLTIDGTSTVTMGRVTVLFTTPSIFLGTTLTLADDTFIGTSNRDFIEALDGNDQIAVGDNDDFVEGGDGDDLILGEGGDDLLFGDAGDDDIDGGADNDTLYGGDGLDSVKGGDGNDTLFGEDGDDFLNGKFGNDELFGGNGADLLVGDDGTDMLYGGLGNDRLYGSQGNDILYGEGGDDELYGSVLEDVLYGGEGDDDLYGGTENDTLYGGLGEDTLFGDGGDDQLFGEGDEDFLNGKSGDDELNGGNGADILVGDLGDDDLNGERGNDKLYGSGGNDRLVGGLGADDLFGSGGDDILSGDDGNDYLVGANGLDILSGGSGNDLMFGGGAADTISGGDGDDTANGGAGGDTITGGDGNDTVNGNAGNDTLEGGRGNDILIGEGGNDTIIGGFDDDVMTGGGAIDTFVFANRFGVDRITDFKNNVDMLDFSGNAFLNNFSDIATRASQVGADVIIDNGPNNTLILENFNLADLDASDFIF